HDPTACMWTPWRPGGSPATFICTRTVPPASCVSVAVPTRAPAELMTTACALAAGGAARSGAPEDAHAASVLAENPATTVLRIDIDSFLFVVCRCICGSSPNGSPGAATRAGVGVFQDRWLALTLLVITEMQKGPDRFRDLALFSKSGSTTSRSSLRSRPRDPSGPARSRTRRARLRRES